MRTKSTDAVGNDIEQSMHMRVAQQKITDEVHVFVFRRS